MEIKIYGLLDPRTNNIRYVGKTSRSLNERLSAHLRSNQGKNNHKHNWISLLKKENIGRKKR